MRRTRRMTTGERWELGLFLSMLIVACLCLTAILNLPGLPKLFASLRSDNALDAATQSPAAVPSEVLVPIQSQPVQPLQLVQADAVSTSTPSLSTSMDVPSLQIAPPAERP